MATCGRCGVSCIKARVVCQQCQMVFNCSKVCRKAEHKAHKKVCGTMRMACEAGCIICVVATKSIKKAVFLN